MVQVANLASEKSYAYPNGLQPNGGFSRFQ